MATSAFASQFGVFATNVDILGAKLERGVYAAVEFQRGRSESMMRSGAKWTDQTSNARNGLIAATDHRPGKHELILAHSVPYGIWLEVRWSGRLAIIEPSLNPSGTEIMKNLQGIFGRI